MNISKINQLSFVIFISISVASCSKHTQTVDPTAIVIKVESANFLTAGLSEPISIVSRTLSNGSTADCYKIVSMSTPTDHTMGPWCPTNISDDKTKGGIWLEGGNVYDVDGAFIKNLAAFYSNTNWQMYNSSTGAITKTLTQADCQAAANPNVGAAYRNYCVECLPSYVSTLTKTYANRVKDI